MSKTLILLMLYCFKNEASFLLSFLDYQFLVVLYDKDMIMYWILIRTYLFLYVYAYIDLLWYSNLISPMSCLITLNSIWVATNWKKTFWVTLVGALAYLGPWHITSEQQPPAVCGPCQDLKTRQRMATMWWAIQMLVIHVYDMCVDLMRMLEM